MNLVSQERYYHNYSKINPYTELMLKILSTSTDQKVEI